jgi:hypothetical protein
MARKAQRDAPPLLDFCLADLRCGCGSAALISIAPGDVVELVPGGFPISIGKPIQAWCEACAPWVPRVDAATA